MASSTSSSELSDQESTAMRKQKRGPSFIFLVPLIYAPILPLIRISLRHKPVLRDRLFTGVLAGAFAHGAYLVYPFFFLLFLFHIVFRCLFSSLLLCQCHLCSLYNLTRVVLLNQLFNWAF